MGIVFGRMSVETPKFQALKSTTSYEIRKYPPSVVAQVTYDPSQVGGERGGFGILANYIGVTGRPQNTKPEKKISMTTPVITSTEPQKIAMTTPVITSTEPQKIAMTTPVITSTEPQKIAMTTPVMTASSDSKMVTMEFGLPSAYTKAEEAPKPSDERIVIKEVGEKTYGVVSFSGVASESVVENKAVKLKESLEKDGHKVTGDFVLARYNPPWFTLPPFRTNEIRFPVEIA
ncbi:hypothetical protein ACHQM5_002343 [Ranunculus cassubicifolius]